MTRVAILVAMILLVPMTAAAQTDEPTTGVSRSLERIEGEVKHINKNIGHLQRGQETTSVRVTYSAG